MKKLIFTEKSKIYVLCPASTATGGPELLHQLVYNLNKLGINAYMYYYPANDSNPVHEEYLSYNNNYVTSVEDSKDNVLIIPEIKTNFLYKYKKIQKVIWWMSVNNYFLSLDIRASTTYTRYLVKRFINYLEINKFFKFFEDKNRYFHFYQSTYAKYFLLDRGVNIDLVAPLSDYLNNKFLQNALQIDISKKEDIIVYNPKKGLKFTKKIIDSLGGNFNFVALVDMTRDEVINILSRAKIYIDFGNHPGKDRIPREAGALYCCILTGKLGSAKFYDDIAIDDSYKFDDNEESIRDIKHIIEDIIKNYESHINNFEYYRKVIKNEEKIFIQNIEKIFQKSR